MNFIQKEKLKRIRSERLCIENKNRKAKNREVRLNQMAQKLSIDQQKHPTIWERIFMDALDLQGIKYEYQKPIVIPPKNFYVLDFYLPAKNMAIEIDGYYHFKIKQQLHDLERSKKLREIGIRVRRFTNTEISKNLDLVMSAIFGKY